ncbi:MAG TPA: adenylate/guanylate cyclase domain-containing protein [Frankiaceae bacterium]|nr:adenylate/guanylate cyclase domain-containing protein [Frankiaceae bacterium]
MSFLFTDIEGSTALWDTAPAVMAVALERHDAILRGVISSNGGVVFATGGDGFCVAFDSAAAAVGAAVDAQRQLSSARWPSDCEPLVRMGIHTGEAVERAGDYFGPAVNLCARLMGAAHGGQVLCTDIVAALTKGAVPTIALGEHRLRGITAAVVVHQVVGTDLPAEFGQLKTLDIARTNLPHRAADVVGRSQLVAEVAATLSEARLVTLTGVGGVGKTTVALAAGRELADVAPDGVWLCELAAVADAGQVLDAVATGLTFTPPNGTNLREALAQYLEGRDLVVIVDNCEHVVDGAAEVVGWLLNSFSSVRVLATSREALAVAGERVIAVAPLALPRSGAAEDVTASAAGALFVARASDATAGWRLDERNAPAVAQICQSLDGIPLAVELAAACSAVLDVTDIASRLDARFDLLGRPRRSGQPRHQTLRAALEWSYDLLEPGDQLLLRQLSVFVDSFDIDAVVAVAAAASMDEWAAMGALTSLVAKCLVERDPRTAGRYRLLETIRYYASSLSDSDHEAWRTGEAHAEYFLGVLCAEMDQLRATDGVDATERLVADAANIELALSWHGRAGRAGDAFRVFTRLPPISLNTLPIEVTDRLARALERLVLAPESANQPAFSAGCAAAASILMDDHDQSRVSRVLDARDLVPDDPHTALCDSTVCGASGDMARGVEVTKRGLQQLDDRSDPLLRSALLTMLSIFEVAVDPVAARADAEEALALTRAHGGTFVQLQSLMALAMSSQSDPTGCAAAATEAVRLDRTARRTFSTIATMLASHATAAAGDLSSGLPLFRQSIVQLHRAGNRQSLAFTVGGAADVIAAIAPDLALELLCIAECGAIKTVGILENPNYPELRRLATEVGAASLAALRAQFAQLSYDEAVRHVLATLDRVAASDPV